MRPQVSLCVDMWSACSFVGGASQTCLVVSLLPLDIIATPRETHTRAFCVCACKRVNRIFRLRFTNLVPAAAVTPSRYSDVMSLLYNSRHPRARALLSSDRRCDSHKPRLLVASLCPHWARRRRAHARARRFPCTFRLRFASRDSQTPVLYKRGHRARVSVCVRACACAATAAVHKPRL